MALKDDGSNWIMKWRQEFVIAICSEQRRWWIISFRNEIKKNIKKLGGGVKKKLNLEVKQKGRTTCGGWRYEAGRSQKKNSING